MNITTFSERVTLRGCLFGLALAVFLLSGVIGGDAEAKAIKQKGFASPEEAVKAFVEGMRANDTKGVWAILGGKRLLSSGDPVEDKADIARFITAYDQKQKIEMASADKAVLSVGADDWPFPIPVVMRGDAWYFDTKAGKDEIFNRRIGRNELHVIDSLHAFVDHSRDEAKRLRDAIIVRLAACGLELNLQKTKIVYCKDDDRRGNHEHEKFTFLGYEFRPRRAKNYRGKYFISFLPPVSDKAAKKIRQEVKGWKLHLRSDKTLDELARMFNSIIRGWVQYDGRYYRSMLHPVFRPLDRHLVRWACRKYKKLRGHRRRAAHWLRRISVREPKRWAHWEIGVRVAVPLGISPGCHVADPYPKHGKYCRNPSVAQAQYPAQRRQFAQPLALLRLIHPLRIMPKRMPTSGAAVAIHHCFFHLVVSDLAYLSAPALQDFPFTTWTFLWSVRNNLDFRQF